MPLQERIRRLAEGKDNYWDLSKKLQALKNKCHQSQQQVSRCAHELQRLQAQCAAVPAPGIQEAEALLQQQKAVSQEAGRFRLFGAGKKKELEAQLQAVQCRLTQLQIWEDRDRAEKLLIAAQESQQKASDQLKASQPLWESQMADYEDSVKQLAGELDDLPDVQIAGLLGVCLPLLAMLPLHTQRRLCGCAEKRVLESMPIDIQIKCLFDKNCTVRFSGRDWNVVRIWKDEALLLSRLLVQPAYGRRPDDWLDNRLLEDTSPQERSAIQPTDGKLFWNLWDVQVRNWLQTWNLVTDGNWWLGKDEDGPNAPYLCYVSTHGNIHRVSPYEYVSAPSGYRPAVRIALNTGVADSDWMQLWEGREGFLDCTGYWKMEKEADAWVPDYRLIEARVETLVHPNKPKISTGGMDLLPGDSDYHG